MVKKGQYYIIEATLAGIALIAVLMSVFYFDLISFQSSDDDLVSTYCEDSLQVLIKRDLLQDESDAVSELNEMIPKALSYCLKIDGVEVSCSNFRSDVYSCRGIYSYLDGDEYKVKEVQLLLS